MQIGIERALGGTLFKPVLLQDVEQLLKHKLHAIHPTGINIFTFFKRAVEIVKHRQQILDQPAHAFIQAIRADRCVALAVIVKIRLQTLRHCDGLVLVLLQCVDAVFHLDELIPGKRYIFRNISGLFRLDGCRLVHFNRFLHLLRLRLFLLLCQVIFAPLQTYS